MLPDSSTAASSSHATPCSCMSPSESPSGWPIFTVPHSSSPFLNAPVPATFLYLFWNWCLMNCNVFILPLRSPAVDSRECKDKPQVPHVAFSSAQEINSGQIPIFPSRLLSWDLRLQVKSTDMYFQDIFYTPVAFLIGGLTISQILSLPSVWASLSSLPPAKK